MGWTDVRTDRWTHPVHFWPTSGHFQSTSGSLLVHLAIMGGHMRHHSYSLPKKMKFPKFPDGRTYIRTDGRKKVTPKDPLRINARDLKKTIQTGLRRCSHSNSETSVSKKVKTIFPHTNIQIGIGSISYS